MLTVKIIADIEWKEGKSFFSPKSSKKKKYAVRPEILKKYKGNCKIVMGDVSLVSPV